MASQAARTYTYQDLLGFPEENGPRREVIDGELIVTPTPVMKHQRVLSRLGAALFDHVKRCGGEVVVAGVDHYITATNVIIPDLFYVREEHLDRLEGRNMDAPPDLVIEISSPSTRARDLGRKKELYEAFGVEEYWFVDLKKEQVVLHHRDDGYDKPVTYGLGETVTSRAAAGLKIAVDVLMVFPARH